MGGRRSFQYLMRGRHEALFAMVASFGRWEKVTSDLIPQIVTELVRGVLRAEFLVHDPGDFLPLQPGCPQFTGAGQEGAGVVGRPVRCADQSAFRSGESQPER